MIRIKNTNNYEEILKRLLDAAPGSLDRREGSILYDFAGPTALELSNSYSMLHYVLINSRVETVEDWDILVMMANEVGVKPRYSTQAEVLGEFNIEIGYDPKFRVENTDVFYYVSEYKGKNEESGLHEYSLICTKKGTIGNYREGILLPLQGIEGLAISRIKDVLVPGTETESIESLRKRVLQLRKGPFSGNRADYERILEEMPGVGRIKAHRRKSGEVNVIVEVQDDQYGVPTEGFIQEIQEYIDPVLFSGEGVGAIGIDHRVLIKAVEAESIDISLSLEFEESSFDAVKEEIIELIETYFLEENKKWADSSAITIRTAHIISKILSVKGIKDVVDIKVNSFDRVVLDNKIAKLGAVTNA